MDREEGIINDLMTADSYQEKRQHPRKMVRILVDYSSTDSFLFDYSSDVSEGGVFIQTSDPLEMGEELDLKFTLPGTDHLYQLKGQVAWVNKRKEKPIDSESGLHDLDDLLANAEVSETTEEPFEDGMPEGMGIKFLNITPEEQEALREFLEKGHY